MFLKELKKVFHFISQRFLESIKEKNLFEIKAFLISLGRTMIKDCEKEWCRSAGAIACAKSQFSLEVSCLLSGSLLLNSLECNISSTTVMILFSDR